MKRVEVTAPQKARDPIEEIIQEYDEDASVGEVEKDGEPFVKVEVSVDSSEIDELVQKVKEVKDTDRGDLTINVLEETASIEKGVRREGGTQAISVQEMYTKAFSFSSFATSSWALIGLGAIIAVFGLVTQNVMVVVGAMVITPMLGPFMALSFGLVIGDSKIIEESLMNGVMSILLAVAVAFLVGLVIPVRLNPLILLIAEPGFATVPLSLAVGAAAALTFMTEARENLAGIAVAIALVPPAAVAGLMLSIPNVDVLLNVSIVILSNIAALIFAGSVTFKLFGIRPATYYRKKVSEERLRTAIVVSAVALLLLGGFIAYTSYQDLRISVDTATAEQYIEEQFEDRVLLEEVTAQGDRLVVTAAVVNPQVEAAQVAAELEERTGRDVTVKLIAIEGQVETG